MRKPLPLLLGSCAALCAIAIFIRFAGPGLSGGFMPDDLMNLHRAARTPVLEFLRGTFAPWAGDWRPFGFLVFKGLYAAFGFNPLPYHALALSLIAANAALLTLLAWRVATPAAAAFTALLVCHHGYFSDLYLNSGTMFDTLASTICLALIHSHISQPRPGPARLIAQFLLFLFALQIKEIAIFLPVAIWAHEFLVRREPGAWRNAHQAWAYTSLAAIFALGLLLNGGEILGNPEYRPHLSPAVLLARWEHYLTNMFYQSESIGPNFTAAILAVAAFAAFLSRVSAARWAWLLAVTSPLPVLAVTPRSFYAFYLPYLFWALLAGIVLARLTRRWRWAPAALFVVLGIWLVDRHLWIQPHATKWHENATRELRPALTFIPPEARLWPRGASILFHDDPYPLHDYTLLYVATLASGDLGLYIHRVKAGVSPMSRATFHYSMTEDRLTRLPGPPSP
jgi:hypothetical protein